VDNCLANKAAAKDRIISATLDIIGNEGFQNVTVRKIAAEAGVNIAAVNYYFGSKDNVVNEALRYMTEKIDNSFKYLDDMSVPPETRLRNFLRNYSDAMLTHPDVFKNYVSQSIIKFEIEKDDFLKDSKFDKLKSTLEEIKKVECDKYLAMRMLQIIGSLSFPVVMGGKINKLYGIDYSDRVTRYEYVELLLKAFICE
jgi:TetR/AcrR family transcriptional regulator, regulator of cefoperazone and chloramphenicol sensitivity